jgi:tripartite ATP-independent transporter DctM subunit
MAANSVIARRQGFPVEEPVPLRKLPLITIHAMPALMMPVILLGGIYGGVTTPTEAAAIAAAYAFLVSVLLYRDVSASQVYEAVLTSARSSASIGILIGGALVFNYVVTAENIPSNLSAMIAGRDLSPIGFLLLVNITLLVLGCLLEGITILLVIVPIFIPTANALGIDMVHFGVVVVVNLMIGLITPPYGLLLFVVANIARVGLLPIVRDIIPFLLVLVAALAFVTFAPGVVLWLPRLLGYSG